MKPIFTCTGLYMFLTWLLSAPAGLAVEWGRILPEDRDDVPALTVGLISDVQMSIIKGGASVSGGDLSIGKAGWGVGYSHEYWAWLCSMRVDLLLTSMSETETAQQDLYMKTADNVDFNGASYDYMRIPAGTGFENEFTGGWLDLNGMFHPVMFGVEGNTFTPLIEAGFLAMGGMIGVNAGAPASASGAFVTGGDSSGFTSSFTPQLGGGFDWRVGPDDSVNHVIQLHILVAMPGLTDADHLNIKGSYRAQFPLDDYDNTLFAGLDLQSTSTELDDDDERSEFTRSSAVLLFGMTY